MKTKAKLLTFVYVFVGSTMLSCTCISKLDIQKPAIIQHCHHDMKFSVFFVFTIFVGLFKIVQEKHLGQVVRVSCL